jgi:hypothetical protein
MQQQRTRKQRNVLMQQIVNGVLYTLCKPQKAKKQLTAQNGSFKHCGRTNTHGVCV